MAQEGWAGPPGRWPRRFTVACGSATAWSAVSLVLAWGTTGPLGQVRQPGPASVDALLALVAAGTAWLLLSWLALGVLLTALASVPGLAGTVLARAADRATPALARRAAAAFLGAAVAAPALSAGSTAAAGVGVAATTPTVAAAATPGDEPPASRPTIPSADRPVATDAAPAGWSPDRPARAPRPQAAREAVRLVTSATHGQHAVAEEVVVRAGDTLWDIAARALGPQAGPAEIAAEWPRWYHTNRSRIGADPGLILPGQVLLSPPGG